jgi:DNA transformation protein and related proteins
VTDLRELRNIGSVVARELEASGLADAESLLRAGSVEAALRLRRAGFDVCRSKLGGLEGAVRGIAWHLISPEERQGLWDSFVSLSSED